MEPFNYTNRKVVGPAAYAKGMQIEINRVKKLKSVVQGHGSAWSVAHGHANPYEARYPLTHVAELKKAVDRTLCNITDIMDHIIDEGNKLYANTIYADNWVIWHEGSTSQSVGENQ